MLIAIGDDVSDAGQLLLVGGIVGSALAALVSEFGGMPINRVIRGWSPDAVPSDEYAALRARGGRYDLVRTVTALLALACYVAAGLDASG